jgi:hypothetical protein
MTNLRPEDEDLLRRWVRAILEPAKRRHEEERKEYSAMSAMEWERKIDSSDRPLSAEKLREITALHRPGRIDPKAGPAIDLAVYAGVVVTIVAAMLTMWRFS